MIIRFGKSPWSAAYLLIVDKSFAAMFIKPEEEADKISFLRSLEPIILSLEQLSSSSSMWNCWSCFPANKIAWITAMNCIIQYLEMSPCNIENAKSIGSLLEVIRVNHKLKKDQCSNGRYRNHQLFKETKIYEKVQFFTNPPTPQMTNPPLLHCKREKWWQ